MHLRFGRQAQPCPVDGKILVQQVCLGRWGAITGGGPGQATAIIGVVGTHDFAVVDGGTAQPGQHVGFGEQGARTEIVDRHRRARAWRARRGVWAAGGGGGKLHAAHGAEVLRIAHATGTALPFFVDIDAGFTVSIGNKFSDISGVCFGRTQHRVIHGIPYAGLARNTLGTEAHTQAAAIWAVPVAAPDAGGEQTFAHNGRRRHFKAPARAHRPHGIAHGREAHIRLIGPGQ